jgi:hypothetical protein
VIASANSKNPRNLRPVCSGDVEDEEGAFESVATGRRITLSVSIKVADESVPLSVPAAPVQAGARAFSSDASRNEV